MHGDPVDQVLELLTESRPVPQPPNRRPIREALPDSLEAAHELIGQLEVALVRQRTICHAVGRLMERHGMSAETALGAIRRVSQNQNVKMYDLAEQIVTDGNSYGL